MSHRTLLIPEKYAQNLRPGTVVRVLLLLEEIHSTSDDQPANITQHPLLQKPLDEM